MLTRWVVMEGGALQHLRDGETGDTVARIVTDDNRQRLYLGSQPWGTLSAKTPVEIARAILLGEYLRRRWDFVPC